MHAMPHVSQMVACFATCLMCARKGMTKSEVMDLCGNSIFPVVSYPEDVWQGEGDGDGDGIVLICGPPHFHGLGCGCQDDGGGHG